ncbi:hypothetical protein MSAN_01826700 [Mycena sanguinolenta]|uniref:Uncharacterized protein n=1 Tax=Mycena sanguinolenta TaxID=230812 RepID=A0A8H6XQ96_9AGAR|nr:hypothetical protein MSAN_01826700 [Mycena sanguinolenta]
MRARSSRTLIAIATSLSVAPALKVVRIPTMRIYGPTPPEHLSLIAKNPRLQSIEFTVRSNPKLANAWTSTSPAFSHPSLRGLIKVPEIPEPSPSRSPTPRPSSSNPQLQYSTESVPEEIWNRILRFAMARDPENQETHSHRLWLRL